VNGRYLPRAVLAAAAPTDQEALDAVPLLTGRLLMEKRPTAYVCQNFACRMPVTRSEELAAQLDGSL
jgi:uncharacterized protein YyaL (SSP411 family)